MAFNWKLLKIPRFYGLDLKTNVSDVEDGYSLGLSNVYQNQSGVTSKRRGTAIMFSSDTAGAIPIDEIGTCTLGSTKYWFKFSNGEFHYATTLTGATTTLTPSPAISTTNQIWWVAINDKLFFVDGTNALRFFDGTQISAATVYDRPTVAPSSTFGGAGYDYSYTVERVVNSNATGESALFALLSGGTTIDEGAGATIRVTLNTGPQTLVAGDRIRVYRRPTATGTAWKNVLNNFFYTVTAGDVAAGFADVSTVSTTDPVAVDLLPNLYTDLGIAINKTAPTALQGISLHYGRLVGWKGDYLYCSKVTNPFSFPDDAAPKQAFVYGVGVGDGEDVTAAVQFREALFVFKKTSFYALPGIGPDDTGNNAFAYRRVESNGIGCVGGKSAVVVGDQGDSYLVFLSKQGFMATNGDKPARVGEKIESQVWDVSESILSKAVGFHHKREGFYCCSVGADASKTIWVLDVRKDNGKLSGWYKWAGINPRCVWYDDDYFVFGDAQGLCQYERTSRTALDFSDVRQEYVATGAVNTGTDVITVSLVYETGDAVIVRSSGGVPAGLVANTTYYAIYVSDTTIRLATSEANALAGTAINLTTQGSGTHSLISAKAISAEYTTNWIKCNTSTHVKKFGRPALLLNATASTIALTVEVAYDWVSIYQDSVAISVVSSDLWGTLAWGSFVWSGGTVASNKNLATSRRKARSMRFRITNSTINQDFNCQGLELPFDVIRNRGNYV
jgi:hypothetical protein